MTKLGNFWMSRQPSGTFLLAPSTSTIYVSEEPASTLTFATTALSRSIKEPQALLN